MSILNMNAEGYRKYTHAEKPVLVVFIEETLRGR